MMFTHKSLMTVCCAAVLAFGLAACGSSSSSDDDQVATTTKKPMVPGKIVDPAPTDDEIAAATKAAATKATEIAAEAAQTADSDAGLGGTGEGVAPTDEQVLGEYNLAIKHGETSITVEGTTPDDDVEFMQAMDFGDGRTMHTRTMDADADGNVVTEVVIVSTDIEAPKATAFAMVRNPEGELTQVLDISTDDDADTNEAFAIDETSADVRALVKSAAFTSGTGAVLTFDNNDGTTDDVDEAFETAGTYNGAMGTYRCNATDNDCTVTLDADGAITGMTDGWIFTPATGATSDVADADYLHYGFWLMRTTDADGATTYNEVQTFAGSSIDPSGSLTGVEGSATYEGGAVGVYVRNVFDTQGAIDTATSGHFNADASLMAYFGGDDVSTNKQNTVTGTIDNFVLQHGEENGWSVSLKGDITDTATVVNGTANGGGAEGSFSATFHGDVTGVDHDDDGQTPVIVPLPSSVVGEFDANFSNGSVAGGFGARKQ